MSAATIEEVKDLVTQLNASNTEIVDNLKKELETKEIEKENRIKQLEKELVNAKTIHSGKDLQIDEDQKMGFKDFCDYALTVRKAALRPSGIDERLSKIRNKAAGAGMEEGTDSEGGFLIPTEFSSTLLQQGVEKSDFIKRCTQIPMRHNSIRIPYIKDVDRSGGYTHGSVMLYWTQEEGSKTKSQPKFGAITLTLKKLIGMTYATDEILEDSPMSLAPLLDMMFTDAFAWVLDDMILNGVGASQP
ncbi:MAG: phage major capsid protein, partial [bacterium]